MIRNLRQLGGSMLSLLMAGHLALAQNGDKAGEVQLPVVPADKIPPAPVLSPQEALKSFKLPPGFKIQLVASEPLVHDPVQIVFDPEGRLWVLEMRGFMPTPDGEGETNRIGSVAVLEDTDGDGVMDRRTEFATGLYLPRALSLVKGGALIAEPPNLWWFKDTNGDLRSDSRELVATNYATQCDPALGNKANPEHASNGLLWALDNWIYSANHSVRFRHTGSSWLQEPTRERGQWGISQDDFGRLVYNSNSDQLRIDLLPTAYLGRNPNFPNPLGGNFAPVPNQEVWPARVNPGVNRGYQRGQLRADGTLATFTAACAPVVYRGDLLPPDCAGNIFLCEPSANLVRRNVMQERDGMISANNPYRTNEFLTSTDERFRPVNLSNGPDGALYVVDLYRGIIQHRVYLTSYLRKQSVSRGLESPIGLGRIYKVVPENQPANTKRPQLSAASTPDLVAALSHTNGWWRDTAQRLLIERNDNAAVPLLRESALKNQNFLGRIHALWTLEGMTKLDTGLIAQALGDSEVKVRVQAMRLAEPFLRGGAKAQLLPALLKNSASTDGEIQTQLALTLGELDTPETLAALVAIAEREPKNQLVADAIITSLKGRELAFLNTLVAAPAPAKSTAVQLKLLGNLAATVYRSRSLDGLDQLFQKIAGFADENPLKLALLDGLAQLLPVSTPGKPAPIVRKLHLAAEPKSFASLAGATNPAIKLSVEKITQLLTWPGKAGEAAEVAVKPLTADEQKRFEEGKVMFMTACAACHQLHGKGQEGLAPPLVDSDWALGSEERVVRIVLGGLSGPINVQGKTYTLQMPSLGVLDDNQIAGVLTYIRREWGHTASPISPETVARIRAATDSRTDTWNEKDLLNIK